MMFRRAIKQTIKWVLVAVAIPLLLLVLLAVLLYVPPVQDWAVQRVTAIASEETGMQISVGRVGLRWPLQLALDRLRVISDGDTLAAINRLDVNVRLRPLLGRQLVMGTLEARSVRLNTGSLLSDISVEGAVQQLLLMPNAIDLRNQVADLSDVILSGGRLNVMLSDTAAVDTTSSPPLAWLIKADLISVNSSEVNLRLPGDTLAVGIAIGKSMAKHVYAAPALQTYRVGSLDWTDGRLSYDNFMQPQQAGLDPSHIRLTLFTLGIDSANYSPQGISLSVREARASERSGLEITELSTALSLDTAMTRISMPRLTLRTPDSDMEAEASLPLSADYRAANAAAADLSQDISLRLNANLGKQDLARLSGMLPQKFIEQYPNHPLTIRGSLGGSMKQLHINGLDIQLPTAFHVRADGQVVNAASLLAADSTASTTATSPLRASLNFQAEARRLDFLTALLPADISKNYSIPTGLTAKGKVEANGPQYCLNLTGNTPAPRGAGTGGSISLDGSYNSTTQAYAADVSVRGVDARLFMPHDSIGLCSVTAHLKGQGTDLLSPRSRLMGDATVDRLTYGQWDISGVTASVELVNGHAQGLLTSHNPLLDGTIGFDASVDSKHLDATLTPDIAVADIHRMRLLDNELTVGLDGKFEIHSDLKSQHLLRGRLGHITLSDEKQQFRPEDIGIFLSTTPDTTWVRAQSGSFIVKLDACGGYERLMAQATTLVDSLQAQYRDKVIDQSAIKRLLPTMTLHVSSGSANPLVSFLRTMNVEMGELLVDLNTSPATGINGQAHVYSLLADSMRIDTIRLALTQKGERLTYQGQVTNNRRNPQFVFNALIDGHIHQHGALAGLRYYDEKGRMGVRLGASADMEVGGLRLRLMPERPTIGYKEFTLNKDNYIFLGSDSHVEAQVDLVADDGTGLKLYSSGQGGHTLADGIGTATDGLGTTAVDGTTAEAANLIDLTFSLNRFNLGDLTAVMPYMPQVTGLLEGDFHIVQDAGGQISVASDMGIQQLTYEGSPIGNLSTELAYLQLDDDGHAIEARLMLDDEEFGVLSGTLRPTQGTPQQATTNHIDATFTMSRLPLSLVNGFVPDQLLGLDGYAEGTLTIKGTTQKPVVDGEVMLESAHLISQPYGVKMRFDDDPVRIVGSHLLLENFGLYAYNEEPLNMMADIDFSNLDRITMDMRMRARNLLLINAKQEPQSVAFGKAYVNFLARMNGPIDALKMRGRLDVLGNTDLTYMLLDSPLSTDNRLDELVKFTDFSDTTQTAAVTRPAPTGLDMDLTISVSQGAHIVCDLNVEQTNYVDLMGGGDLRMRYGANNLTLHGRYTLASGEMKYSMPVIPLKTFTIQDGSYVEFTGDPMNPRLNITATERTKVAVSQDGTQSRNVIFDCGVVITKTLSDMGLLFTISAPEDNTINSELQAMSTEERGKLAVTMLTTGMYLADGNTSSFSMNSALSTFLQSEINNITGSALKTLDLSVGLDNATDASGESYTDYSFKFSKRLFDNRLKIQLGGKVSTATEMPGQKQSFFDNITMEYRLDQNAQKNVKLYYQQNVYDWLDGYTGVYGGGFVWRKKMDSLLDVFKWRSASAPALSPRQPGPGNASSPTAPADSTGSMRPQAPDSIKERRTEAP